MIIYPQSNPNAKRLYGLIIIGLLLAPFFLAASNLFIPTVNAPSGWYDPSWTKRRTITIDNTGSVGGPVGKWTDKTAMPLRLSDSSSAVIDGKMYVFGGYGPGGASDVRSEVYAYDPVSNSWAQKASMPGGHSYAAGACAVDTKAYVFGGISSGGSYYKTLYIYDSVADSWSAGGDLPVSIGIHSPSVIGYNGLIYIIGGFRDGGDPGTVTVYDPVTNTYDTSKASMPTPRRFFSLSEVGGILYAIGGGGPANWNSGTNEVYNVATNTWTTKATMPFGRWGLARENAAINGKIYISHGMISSFYTDAAAYDTTSNTWQILPSASHARDGHNCGIINGKLYAVGGRDGSGALTYNEQFDPDALPPGPPDLTNYQVRINVAYDSDMKTDFSDLRFTDSDGTTLLSYWVQTYTASASAIFWAKVPSILASSTKTIYMYYGNPSAGTTSNGENTFDLFDDFNILSASKWSIKGSPRVESGALIIDTIAQVTSLSSFGTGHALETEAYIGSTTSNGWLGFCASDAVGPFILVDRYGSVFQAWTYSSSQVTPLDPSYLNAYHWYTITFVTGTEKLYIDDSLKVTHTQALSPMPVEFRAYSGAATIKSQWIAVRNYSSPEPTTTIGPEEANAARLYINPALVQKTSGDIGTYFNVTIEVDSVTDLFGFDCQVTWDNTLITLHSSYYNDTLDGLWGTGNWYLAKEESGAGSYKLVVVSMATSFNGSQALFRLEFRVEDSRTNILRETPIHFLIHKLSDSLYAAITHTFTDGTYQITGEQPTLLMSPTSKTCRKYDETFTVAITVSNEFDVTDFEFEVHYNTTLLDYSGITWNAWGTGTITVDEANGKITGSTTGSPISGATTLVMIQFNATYYRVWKDESKVQGWKNDQSGLIYIQTANLSYPTSPNLNYVRGGSQNQISVGPDVAYTFSPIQGDVDNNGVVDVFDLRTAAAFYDQANTTYDLNGDGIIDIFDMVIMARNFGFSYP